MKSNYGRLIISTESDVKFSEEEFRIASGLNGTWDTLKADTQRWEALRAAWNAPIKPEPEKRKQESDWDAFLADRRFDVNKPPPPSHPIFKICGKPISTPGNVTVISAHNKTGKSALVGAFIAASFGLPGDTLRVESTNPRKHAVIHFDTEQSPADHHANVVTALSRVNAKAPDWLRSYRIADTELADRFKLLRFELERADAEHGGVHSVLLDGVADFVGDLNDPKESFAAVALLHRLAVQYACAIVCVIHFNPGTEYGKTRGHLGSQLGRKAESNLELFKDQNEITTAYTSSSRHAFISKADGPCFTWNSASGMHISCATKRDDKTAADLFRLREIADEAFESPLSYSEAITVIMVVAKVKERQAEALFTQINKAGLIEKNRAKWRLVRAAKTTAIIPPQNVEPIAVDSSRF